MRPERADSPPEALTTLSGQLEAALVAAPATAGPARRAALAQQVAPTFQHRAPTRRERFLPYPNLLSDAEREALWRDCYPAEEDGEELPRGFFARLWRRLRGGGRPGDG